MGEFSNWLKTLFIGKAPKIDKQFLRTGALTGGLKSVITKDIEYILSKRKGQRYKFGKTGFAPTRADQDDYRAAPYNEMFLLYKTSSKDNAAELESYYATKYHKHNDNTHTHSAGRMRSFDGFYYLYMVI